MTSSSSDHSWSALCWSKPSINFLEKLFRTFSIGACRRIVPDGQIDSEILCYTKYSPLLVHVVSVALVKIFTPARVVLDNIFTPALLCGECFENIHPCSWGECCVAVKTIDH